MGACGGGKTERIEIDVFNFGRANIRQSEGFPSAPQRAGLATHTCALGMCV